MRLWLSISACLLAVVILACGSKPSVKTGEASKKTVEEIPDWYKKPPSDPNYLFSAATSTSKDMQMSVDKAKQQARADLAQQLEMKIEALTKKFDQEVGLNQDSELLGMYTQTVKVVVSTTLNGSRVDKQDIKIDNGLYRAYVLVELPLGAANAALMERIKANQTMYIRFQESNAFKELEEEVKKYEEFKKEQELR